MTNAPADSRSGPNMVQIPFIFVKLGDPLPMRGMAEHSGYIRVPAVMVPRGSPPPRERGARACPPTAVQGSPPALEPHTADSFAPPATPRKCLPGGQDWPGDTNGRDWPKDRWGRPMRSLWDYPPGVRAPGEGVARGEPGSISAGAAIGMARAASAVLDPASQRTLLASGRTGTGLGTTQTPQRSVASRYSGAYDVAQAEQSQEDGRSARQAHLTPAQQAAIAAAAQDWANSNVPYVTGGMTVQGADCSGAVYGIYRQAGIDIKYKSSDQFRSNPQFSPVTGEPEVGDVGWYKGHVVIYGGTTGPDRDVWSASLPRGPAFGPGKSSWYGTPYWYRYNGTQQ